jgi:uncharacterized cupin superfamily protein
MSKPPLVRLGDRPDELAVRHPLNPNSEIHGFQLSRLTGLARTAVNWIRIPPGRESYVYHAHDAEEEWIYVLSGRGVAEIDGAEHEVAAGDFMGFPAPSVAHHLRNPFGEDLVYLCGGEIRDVEVCDYPRNGLVLIRRPEGAHVVPASGVKGIAMEAIE